MKAMSDPVAKLTEKEKKTLRLLLAVHGPRQLQANLIFRSTR
ncbi:hypothetical protein CP97_14755 [Aurantiacibacter atlanticus]|uniref:Uncharacterized protein n=1 Tax=Aurantiacibacter atlanticus TaxID=1648404 RepID=A0A161I474_9SPHN|nr:hypothetical protein CP97_14755 [Aurantiacibacter atlanticus]